MECLILQIEKVIPTTTNEFLTTRTYLQLSKILPEFHILAVIIIVLRLLFGLDDVTERYQSDFAQKVNSTLEESGSNNEYSKLFVIKDWFLYLRQRTKIVDGELHNPYFSPGTMNLPYATMNHFIENYTGFKSKLILLILHQLIKFTEAFQASLRKSVSKNYLWGWASSLWVS